MLVQSEQLQGIPVVSLQTGRPIGRIMQPILDPHKLEIVGFYCDMGQRKILLIQDIRQISPDRLMIDSADNLSEVGDLVRLQEILEIKFELHHKPVRTVSKRRLGKVEEYVIDLDTFLIEKMYVRQPVLKNITGGTLIIDRSQIVEVSDTLIIVSDASVRNPVIATQQAV